MEKGVRIMRDCTTALHDLHAAGVVLEDLKPANVLLDDKDGKVQAVRTDFGISKFLRAKRANQHCPRSSSCPHTQGHSHLHVSID